MNQSDKARRVLKKYMRDIDTKWRSPKFKAEPQEAECVRQLQWLPDQERFEILRTVVLPTHAVMALCIAERCLESKNLFAALYRAALATGRNTIENRGSFLAEFGLDHFGPTATTDMVFEVVERDPELSLMGYFLGGHLGSKEPYRYDKEAAHYFLNKAEEARQQGRMLDYFG